MTRRKWMRSGLIEAGKRREEQVEEGGEKQEKGRWQEYKEENVTEKEVKERRR